MCAVILSQKQQGALSSANTQFLILLESTGTTGSVLFWQLVSFGVIAVCYGASPGSAGGIGARPAVATDSELWRVD